MIIRSIQIDNFQSIEHTVLYPGAWTSLVGESDVGKSAVIRALHAALTNRTGDTFIRHGAKACAVTIATTAGPNGVGPSIVWEKQRGKSGAYLIAHPDGTHETFEKTGGVVPPEVEALLRVQVDVAGEPLLACIQRQHDAPFLLADSPRRRAQVLGEFDGTNITIRTEQFLRQGQRAAQAEVKAAQAAADRAAAAIDRYTPLHPAEVAYEAAERLHRGYVAAGLRVVAMQRTRVRLATQTALAQQARALRDSLGPHDLSMAGIDAAAQRAYALRPLAGAWRHAAAQHAAATRVVAAMPQQGLLGLVLEVEASALLARSIGAKAQQIAQAGQQFMRAAGVIGAAHPVGPAAEAMEQAGKRYADLARAVAAARRADAALRSITETVGLVRDDLAVAQAELDALVGQPCPTCGQPITAV